MILSGNEIKELGLLIGAKDENYQAQGCDICLDKICSVVNKPFGQKITEDDYVECYNQNGCYELSNMTSVLFKIKETVDLTPRQKCVYHDIPGQGTVVMPIGGHRYINAYVLPKSSLSRRGVIVHSAWWDAGYKGSGYVLVRTSVAPLTITSGQAFAQMIFMEGHSSDIIYNGQYQGENTK